MRSGPTTQLGWRLIRKHWKWVELSEMEAGLWRDIGDQGMNHDRGGKCKNEKCAGSWM